MIPGLVSVTFRQLQPREICALCMHNDLHAIEWGGDIHVPCDGKNAGEIRAMSQDANIEICSYGTYYRVGEPVEQLMPWLDTAKRLGTDMLRVWCGRRPSDALSAMERNELLDFLAMCCERAAAYDAKLALEFHGNTLTDSLPSVQKLLAETEKMEHLRFYWQPRWDWPEEDNLQAFRLVWPRLAHVHMFSWKHTKDGTIRLPLNDGAALWEKVLPYLQDHYGLLEFVRSDAPSAFCEDAAVLKRWAEG